MGLTRKQEEAIKIAVDRYKNKERYTVIGGYAGVGKSYIVKYIIDAIGVKEEDVCFCSLTGKATEVLQKKGNKNVRTLHKLLYISTPNPDGTFDRKPVDEVPYKIIVVDEVSMIPKELLSLLLSYKNLHIICLGDPFQLPTIKKEEDNYLLNKPHIFLDEVMRQSQESEIIRFTMNIREGKTISPMKGKDIIIIQKNELNTGMLLWADQIICSTNLTRQSINKKVRFLLGRESLEPEENDKIICLTNYWNIFSNDETETPLINGTIGKICNPNIYNQNFPSWITNESIKILNCDFISDSNSSFKRLKIDKGMIVTGENSLDRKVLYKLSLKPKTKKIIPLEFAYGYAITCHKAQGSEWNKVLAIEENFPWDKKEHDRLLYTCATRASEKLVLCLKD